MRRREQRRYYPSYFIRNDSLYANARQGGRRESAIRSLAATISIKRDALSPCDKGKRQSPNPCRRIQTAIKKNPQDKEKPSRQKLGILLSGGQTIVDFPIHRLAVIKNVRPKIPIVAFPFRT